MDICFVGTGTQFVGKNSSTAVEIIISNLSRELSELGNKVAVIDIYDCKKQTEKNVEYHNISMLKSLQNAKPAPGSPLHVIKKLIFSIKTLFLVAKLKNKFDIIHIQNQYPGFFLILFKKLLGKSKFVYTSHTPFWTLDKKEFNKKYYFKTIMDRFSLRHADKAVAIGQTQGKDIADKAKINQEHIAIIENGVDEKKFKPLVKKSKNIEFVSVARINPIKNQFQIIRAIPEIIKHNQNITFTFIGQIEDEKYLADMKEYILKNGISKNVRILGKIDNHLLPEYYGKSDVFISASTNEGFPLTALEAMSSGCGLLLSSISPHLELKKTGSALYFKNEAELSKEIINISKDKQKLKILQKNAYKNARKYYSWKSVAKNNLDLYKSII